MAMLLSVLGKLGASIGATLIASLLTEKVVMRIMLILADKMVKSSKNEIDDQIWAPMKEAIEKELQK